MILSELIKSFILVTLGIILGIIYGFFLVNQEKTHSFKFAIFYYLRTIIVLIIFFYLLHLFKIQSILFLISFIVSFWTFIIKYKY